VPLLSTLFNNIALVVCVCVVGFGLASEILQIWGCVIYHLNGRFQDLSNGILQSLEVLNIQPQNKKGNL
jgi:hypothetical protein